MNNYIGPDNIPLEEYNIFNKSLNIPEYFDAYQDGNDYITSITKKEIEESLNDYARKLCKKEPMENMNNILFFIEIIF